MGVGQTHNQGGNVMPADKLTIKLTDEQQKQIKKATGKSIAKLNIDLAATGLLSDTDLGKVVGGVESMESIVTLAAKKKKR
jgi:hypothetical protein